MHFKASVNVLLTDFFFFPPFPVIPHIYTETTTKIVNEHHLINATCFDSVAATHMKNPIILKK